MSEADSKRLSEMMSAISESSRASGFVDGFLAAIKAIDSSITSDKVLEMCWRAELIYMDAIKRKTCV